MPNQNLKAQPLNKKRILLLGDSFNMRHPLTGGGMSVAFNDIKNIVKYFSANQNLDNEKNINSIIKKHYKKRSKDVANINVLADSLYHASIDPNLKRASFNYLKQESHQKRTIQIIAGIDKKKYNLIQQFVLVVLDGINKLELTQTKKLVLLTKATKIIVPLLVQEGDSKLYKWSNQLLQKITTKLSDKKKSPQTAINGKKLH